MQEHHVLLHLPRRTQKDRDKKRTKSHDSMCCRRNWISRSVQIILRAYTVQILIPTCLISQHILSDTDSHLSLLLALSSLNPTAPPSLKARLRASRSVPSMAPTKQSEATRLGLGHPVPLTRKLMKEIDTKGKTKAEVMAAWRQSQGEGLVSAGNRMNRLTRSCLPRP